MSFLECDLHGICHFWIVLFLECDQNGMSPFWNVLYWNVLFLAYPLFGMCFFEMCSFWNILFLECVNWMWQKMECDKNGLSGWLRQSWSSMWYLLNIQISKLFFIIFWVKPLTFHVSNLLEKGFLCHSWELFYLFTFAAIYSQLQATKRKCTGWIWNS